jgi:hypothetical protein
MLPGLAVIYHFYKVIGIGLEGQLIRTKQENFLKKDGLIDNGVWSIIEDKVGNI